LKQPFERMAGPLERMRAPPSTSAALSKLEPIIDGRAAWACQLGPPLDLQIVRPGLTLTCASVSTCTRQLHTIGVKIRITELEESSLAPRHRDCATHEASQGKCERVR